MDILLCEINKRIEKIEKQNRFFKTVFVCAAIIVFFTYKNIPVKSEQITKQAEIPNQIKAVLMLDEKVLNFDEVGRDFHDIDIIISPDSEKFIVKSLDKIKIWDRNVNLLLELDGDFSNSKPIFSPDGTRFGLLENRNNPGRIRVWVFEESTAEVESFQIHESYINEK